MSFCHKTLYGNAWQREHQNWTTVSTLKNYVKKKGDSTAYIVRAFHLSTVGTEVSPTLGSILLTWLHEWFCSHRCNCYLLLADNHSSYTKIHVHRMSYNTRQKPQTTCTCCKNTHQVKSIILEFGYFYMLKYNISNFLFAQIESLWTKTFLKYSFSSASVYPKWPW